jgi:TP901 family phage tail tape measure protein
MSTSLGTARGRIILDTSSIPGALGRAEASVLGFTRSTVGLSAALVGGAGIVAAVRDTLSASATFEQRLSGLRAVSGATASEMARLSEQALELGQSSAFSASEVATAQTELAKAGVSVADVLGGGLQGALALAAAGELEVGEAATIAANAMNQFNLAGSDLTHVADALATAANNTTADVGDVGAALAQGGAAARAAGLSFDETVTYIQALADASVTGSDAGTSLKAAITQLLSPTDKAAAAIERTGLALFDQAGNLKDAASLSEELGRATAGMNKQQKVAFLTTIAGVDGFRSLLALIDAGPATLRGYERALAQQGTAAETARVKQDNLRGDLEKLGGAIETLQVQAGGGLQGALRGLTQGTTSLIEAASGSDELAALAGGLFDLGTAAGGAAVSLGPLVSNLAGIAGAATGAVGALASTEAGALSLQFALTGLAGAYGAAKVASLAGAVTRSSPGAFLGLAAGVRSASDAAALAGATFPRTASAIAAMRGVAAPAGVAIAGLGVSATTGASTFATLAAAAGTVAIPAAAAAAGIGLAEGELEAEGAVLLLSSGAFSGATTLEALAAGLDRVKTSAAELRATVDASRVATGQLTDANLAERGSLLALGEANRNLKALRDSGTASLYQLQQAELAVDVARRNHNRNRQATAQAEQAAGIAAAESVVSFGRMATELRRTNAQGAAAEAITKRYATSLGLPAKASGELARQLADQQKEGAKLPALYATVQNAVRKYVGEIDTSTRRGREQKRAIEDVLKINPAAIPKFSEVYQRESAKGIGHVKALERAIAAASKVPKPVSVVVKTDKALGQVQTLEEAILGIDDRDVAVEIRDNTASAIAGIQQRLSSLDDQTVFVNIVPRHKRGSWTVQETLEHLERIGGRQAVDVTFRPHGTGAIERDLDSLVAAFDRQLEGLDERVARRAERQERARLNRALAEAEAQQRRAKTPTEGREAARAVADAKSALAEFRFQAMIEGRRAGIELRQGVVDGLDEARGGLSSAMSDLGGLIGDSLQRGLDAKLAGIDASLRSTLEALDAELRSALDALDADLQRTVSGIDSQLDTLRSVRSARDTARQRGELTTTATDAQGVVDRRRATLAAARTESERAAAQRLLEQAIADQAKAAQALADFEEDQLVARLERERAAAQEQSQLRRGLVEADIAARREAAQRVADADRAAAQAEYDALVAQTNRLLGELEGRLARGEISAKQFGRLLARGLGDPRIAAALQDSGERLGLSFARGLERTKAELRRVSAEIAGIPASYLRLRSPADTGPLAFDFERSGATIGRDMAAGLLSTRALVTRASGNIAAALAVEARLVGATATARGLPAGAGGFVQHNTFQVDGPTLSPRQIAAGLGFEARFGGGRAA